MICWDEREEDRWIVLVRFAQASVLCVGRTCSFLVTSLLEIRVMSMNALD